MSFLCGALRCGIVLACSFAEAADRFLVQVVTPVAGQASHRRVLAPGSLVVSEISSVWIASWSKWLRVWLAKPPASPATCFR